MNRGRGKSGFTMIEILVVLVVLTILVGIVVGASKYAIVKGERSRAQSEIAMIENALESYKSDNGAYPPSTAQRTTAAVSGVAGNVEISNSGSLYAALAGGAKVYMTFKANQLKTTTTAPVFTYIVDPFGSPYNYYCPPNHVGQVNGATFDLWSYGPDNMWGVVGTVNYDADNITNWQQ